MNLVFFIAVVCLPMALFYGVLYTFWDAMRSHRESKIWKLRYELFDAIKAKQFEDPKPANVFKDYMEDVLVRAVKAGPLSTTLMRLSSIGTNFDYVQPTDFLREGTERDLLRLQPYVLEFEQALTKSLPWIVLPEQWVIRSVQWAKIVNP